MTRFRWLLGAALVLLSLLAGFRALGTYFQHGLWIASAAVAVLCAIAVGGFASLAIARRRLARELLGLALDPPSSALFEDRRRRLEAIRAAGGAPNCEALAEATAAEESGRAYLGRYFVAVTVLVGLVGTFAGLMETLRGVAPLLADDQADTLKLIAAPLAGLDVTFGASIVGVLVTLALALVQGDLVIAEELVLARLEERAVHLLVPSLWPPGEQAIERAAKELAALRREFGATLASSLEGAGNRIADAAAGEIGKLVREVEGLLSATAKETANEVRLALRDAGAEVAERVRPLLVEGAAELADLRATTSAASAHASAAITEATQRAVVDLERAATAIAASLQRSAEVAALAQQRTETLFAKLSEAHAAKLESAAEQLLAGADRASAAHAQRLESLAATMERAALESTLGHGQLVAQAGLHAASLIAAGDASAKRSEELLVELGNAHAARMDATARSLLGAFEQAIADQAATAAALANTLQNTASQTIDAQTRLLDSAGVHATALALSCDSVAQTTQARLAELGEVYATRLDTLARALRDVIERSATAQEAQWIAATQSLTVAAEALREGAEKLAPSAAALAPELGSLAREIALLAARSEAAQDQAAVVEELSRLGEAMERLEKLARSPSEIPA